jgi:hypothetical protein
VGRGGGLARFSGHLEVCRGTGGLSGLGGRSEDNEEQFKEDSGDACGCGVGSCERGIERGAGDYLQPESFEGGGGAVPVGAEAERNWRDGEIAGAGESERDGEGRTGAGRKPDPFGLRGEGGEAVAVCVGGERRKYRDIGGV